jgi:ADP-ribose pyrophosphatase YjhB (NUDIX family)
MTRQRHSDKRLPLEGERLSHLACSLYLFDLSKQSILLVKHKGLGVWLPPGGHVEEGELPHIAALREAFEETNMQDILLLGMKVGDLHLQSGEQRQLRFSPETEQEEQFLEPFALVEEKILETDKDVEHFHIDYVYVGQLQSSQDVQILPTEVSDAQWVKLHWETIDQLETFPNIKMILKRLQEYNDRNGSMAFS